MGVRADALVELRLHKRPAVVKEKERAEILLPAATAVITSRRGTREHPDQDNGSSREDLEQAEVPGPLFPVSFIGDTVGGTSARRQS